MTLYQVLSIALISVLAFIVWYRGQCIKKLETREPTLDLKAFEAIIARSYVLYGDEYFDIVANTCIYTARRLGLAITAKDEVCKQIKEESMYLLTDLDPDATARLEKLTKLRDLLA